MYPFQPYTPPKPSTVTENQPVLMAWGISQFYRNVPRHLKAEARQRVMQYFSRGKGPYYRYHNGEHKLTPRQQQDVLQIVAHYGSTDDVVFDHYEMRVPVEVLHAAI